METSGTHRTSQLASTSPCGKFIAFLNGAHFEIRNLDDLDTVRFIDLSSSKRARFLQIEWSSYDKESLSSMRVLLADEESTHVWDLRDAQWSAVIDNGSGGMGKTTHVEFGSDESEVLVFSEFGARIAIWSLWTGKMMEIRNPKFTTAGHGWNRIGPTGTLAVLGRSTAQDIVTLHAAGTYTTLKSFRLFTIDAQGLKWSPDGRWLAVWDTPSTAYKVHIYTADGILFRTYMSDSAEDNLAGLGVRSIEWSPNCDFLAVGGYEHTITVLSTRTFSPAAYLTHSSVIQNLSAEVWQEQATAHARCYANITQPLILPGAATPTSDPKAKLGISSIAFNNNGSLLATRDDRLPTAVWIWDVRAIQFKVLLVQHSLVRRTIWHPTNPNILLIQCAQDENLLYYWNTAEEPRILDLSAIKLSGKVEARWVRKKGQENTSIMLATACEFILVYPNGIEKTKFTDPGFDFPRDTMLSNGESEFNIVLRDSPHVDNTNFCNDLNPNTMNSLLDDTFHFRRELNVL